MLLYGVIGLVWGAIWARRAQTATVLALTLLAVGAAAAAPWYVVATSEALSARHIAAAPGAERMLKTVTVRRDEAPQVIEASEVVAEIDEALPVPHEPPITGLVLNSEMKANGATTARPILTVRSRVCEYATVEGSCPAAANEAMISPAASDTLGLEIGDTFTVIPEGTKSPITMTVVGRYRASDPLDTYWLGVFGSAFTELEPFFVSEETIRQITGVRPTTVVDLILRPAAYTPKLVGQLSIAQDALPQHGIAPRTSASDLAKRIDADQGNLSTGVTVAAGRLILLCWFTLLVVVRHTATARRADLGLVKLRGVRRRRLWTMTLGQLAAPMTLGALLGVAVGYLAARLYAGPVTGADDTARALRQSALTVGVVFVGALVVAWASERRELSSRVSDLLRDVPARPPGRVMNLMELVIGLLAVVGIWQLLAVESSRTGTAAPAVVPALIALTVGLLVTRAVLWIAGRAGTWGIRNGYLTIGLAGVAAQRRPALRWVVTLLVIAVAGLAGAIGESLRAAPVVADRAEQEVGVERVLTVSAPGRLALRDAVRAADPTGREAMAVSYFPGTVGFTFGLLAVDSPRLGQVVRWRDEYGPAPTAVPDAAARPTVADGPLTLTVTADATLSPGGADVPAAPPPGSPAPDDVYAVVRLVSDAGRAVSAYWGPLVPGRHEYTTDVTRCGDGCRLASIGIVSRTADRERVPAWGTRVHLHRLGQGGQDVIGTARFADRLGWRTSPFTGQIGPQLLGESDGLALTVPPGCTSTARGRCVPEVFPGDVAVPVPVRLAGRSFYGSRIAAPELSIVGAPAVPVAAQWQADVLPRLGIRGAIVDLTQLDGLIGVGLTGEQLQIWLAGAASPSFVESLRTAGVTVLATQTVEQTRSRYLGEGPAAVRRFELLAAALGLILAAGALLLAASVEQRGRAGELAALRRQGLRAGVVRRVSLAGYAWHGAAGVVGGLAAAVAAGVLPVPPPKIFADDWHALPIPVGGVSAAALGLAALGAGAVTAVAAVFAARRLTGAVLRKGDQR